MALDRLDDRVQRRRAVVLDVERDLRDVLASGKRKADRADAGQAFGAALADGGGDALGILLGGGRGELEVEGDQRRASGHQGRARGGVSCGWPEVRGELAVVQ